jgi:hypothetical protein
LIYSFLLVVLLDISYSLRSLILFSVSVISRIVHSKYLLFLISPLLLVVLRSPFPPTIDEDNHSFDALFI